MQTDTDMSGVDPVRVPEIRRRIAILDEYVALRRPAYDVRKAYADRLGISVSQLYYLARVWRISRDAARIPGARSRFTVPRHRRLDARALEIARTVIDDLGPTTIRKAVLGEVALRCADDGVDPPSNSTITNMLVAARSAMMNAAGLDPEILVDEVTVKLPVADGETVTMPRVLVAVALPQRRIVAAEIGCAANEPPSPAALMRTIEASATSCGTPLAVRAPHLNCAAMAFLGEKAHDGRSDRPQLAQVLGNCLGHLGLLYRSKNARPGYRLASSRHASVLDDAEARHAIADAIIDHNASLPEMPAAGFTIAKPTQV